MKLTKIAYRDELNALKESYPGEPLAGKSVDMFGKEDLGGVYEIDFEDQGILYRGVSEEDFKRIQQTGVIDTDFRNAISKEEGINLARDPETAREYLPKDKGGVILAITTDQLNLYGLNADHYIRCFSPIPASNIIKAVRVSP